jgi:hypothetical protein
LYNTDVSDDYRAAFRALDTGGLWSKLRVSPGDLIRARYLRGEIDAEEAGRRITVMSWMIALLFPAVLLPAFFGMWMLLHRAYAHAYPLAMVQLAALLAPIGPLFAIVADRLIERPALRRAVARRESIDGP